MLLEETLESSLDCKESKPIHPKGNQSWIFIGKTDAQAETPILWPPDVKSWLIWKDPGKDWRQEEKGMIEDGWMASPTRWTWVWASSDSWWWTGKPGMLQSMGSQRIGHDLVTELNWTQTIKRHVWNNHRNVNTEYLVLWVNFLYVKWSYNCFIKRCFTLFYICEGVCVRMCKQTHPSPAGE